METNNVISQIEIPMEEITNYKNASDQIVSEHIGEKYNVSDFQRLKFSYALQDSDISYSSRSLADFAIYLFNGIKRSEAHEENIRNAENIGESEIKSFCALIKSQFRMLPDGMKVGYLSFKRVTRNPFGRYSFDSSVCFRDGADREKIWEMLKDYTENDKFPSSFLRIRNSENTVIGRAISTKVDGIEVIWNCYSDCNDINTISVGNFIAAKKGKKYIAKKITFSNNGASSKNLMYINSGVGVAIIPMEKYGEIDHISVDMDESDYIEGFCCEHCGCEIDEDDGYTDDNGNRYCSDCYCNIFARCECCDNEINTNEVRYYRVNVGRRDIRIFCDNCVEEL